MARYVSKKRRLPGRSVKLGSPTELSGGIF